ncbi:GPI ethanolamine phosphate transferase 1, partial [Ochlerotatus camptorhynchus]|uniref:GPI ethanolamine phosphate transferase 1 n=1 Tax=Ochlerotatus camptorhynchus TaxID=644619 RepID=UPI0031D00158
PYSHLFTENLIIVDKGIEQIVQLIDNITNHDQRTTYIFTSDHGMTDRGSHGSGHPVETETPFVIWGAGVEHWTSLNDDVSNHVAIDGVMVPSWDINQADVTPLISALLGQAIPKNNCGKLPRQYLNASKAYVANAMRKNADQLFQQYYQWRMQSSQKWFQWSISQKETDYVTIINKIRNDIEFANNESQYEKVITLCDVLMDVTLEAIDFYHVYYKNELLFILSFAMLGWLFIVLGKIFFLEDIFSEVDKKILFTGFVVIIVVCGYNLLQGVPKIVMFYFILPVFLWIPVLSKWRAYIAMINWKIFGQTILFIGCSELCVVAFFQRSVLSIFLVVNALYLTYHLRRQRDKHTILLFSIILSNIILAVFPMLPVVEKDSNHPFLLIISTLLWTIGNIIITGKSQENAFYRWIQFIVCVGLALNTLVSIHIIETGMVLSWLNQAMSWAFIAASLIVPLLTTVSITSRLTAIIVNLSGPFLMLSLSYEPLFLMVFSISLFIWLQSENEIFNQKEQISKLFFSSRLKTFKPVDFDDFRRSITFVLYMLVSFFGTGNIATVSSFDPNWVRLLVSTFSPFLMTGLIVFKLLVPILISVCVLRSLQIIIKVKAQTLFLLIFIICDLMCLNFFYLIKNKGSWLEIGSSISHFVIMEFTTIVLIFLYGCAKLMTELSVASFKYHGRFRYMLPFDSKSNKD